MSSRLQRSYEAAYGEKISELATILDRAGVAEPMAEARAFLEQLQRDGWRWRPTEPAPARPTGPVVPASPVVIGSWRERARDVIEKANEEVARREGAKP